MPHAGPDSSSWDRYDARACHSSSALVTTSSATKASSPDSRGSGSASTNNDVANDWTIWVTLAGNGSGRPLFTGQRLVTLRNAQAEIRVAKRTGPLVLHKPHSPGKSAVQTVKRDLRLNLEGRLPSKGTICAHMAPADPAGAARLGGGRPFGSFSSTTGDRIPEPASAPVAAQPQSPANGELALAADKGLGCRA